MKKKARMASSVVVTLVILFSVAFLTPHTDVEAGAKPVAIEGMSYDVNASIADNLKSLIGKKVNVTLDSGQVFSGTVKEVGNHLIHLEKLDRKSFFDALIRLENISAIDAMFRKYN